MALAISSFFTDKAVARRRRVKRQSNSWQPAQNFTVADWLKTQIIHDPSRLDADIGALRAGRTPAG